MASSGQDFKKTLTPDLELGTLSPERKPAQYFPLAAFLPYVIHRIDDKKFIVLESFYSPITRRFAAYELDEIGAFTKLETDTKTSVVPERQTDFKTSASQTKAPLEDQYELVRFEKYFLGINRTNKHEVALFSLDLERKPFKKFKVPTLSGRPEIIDEKFIVAKGFDFKEMRRLNSDNYVCRVRELTCQYQSEEEDKVEYESSFSIFSCRDFWDNSVEMDIHHPTFTFKAPISYYAEYVVPKQNSIAIRGGQDVTILNMLPNSKSPTQDCIHFDDIVTCMSRVNNGRLLFASNYQLEDGATLSTILNFYDYRYQ